MQKSPNGYILAPTPNDPRLTKKLEGVDQHGNRLTTSVVTEKPLTVFLNGQEIVTLMTIGDEPELLAVGFLLNQNMLRLGDKISGIEYEDDLDVVVGLVEAVAGRALDGLDRLHADGDAAEDRVLVVEPGRRHGRDEELGAVRVRPRVGHGHGEGPVVLERRVELVLELAAPDGLAARAVAERVARLDHELLDAAVEDEAVVVAVAGVRAGVAAAGTGNETPQVVLVTLAPNLAS